MDEKRMKEILYLINREPPEKCEECGTELKFHDYLASWYCPNFDGCDYAADGEPLI